MTWLVFAASGLLILAGALSIISGAPMIQLERGWTEVISGTVAVSSGGVIFALGVVLLRLQGLLAALARTDTAAMVAGDATVAPAVSPIAPLDLRPTVDPQEPEAIAALTEDDVPSPVAAPVESRHGLWKRVRRPADSGFKEEPMLSVGQVATEEAAPLVPVIVPGRLDEPARRDAVFAAPQAPEQSPAMELTALRDPTRTADDLVVPEPAVAQAAPSQNRWFKPPAFRERARTAPVETPREDADFEPVAPMDAQPFLETPADEPAAALRFPASPVEAQTTEPPFEKPTVVGRYQAGVASYVMFSDGTINVETEGGDVHRFESMEELKAFIAKQEATVG